MNKKTTKITGTLASLTLLVGAGGAFVASTAQPETATGTQVTAASENQTQKNDTLVSVSQVEGSFSYDQSAVSSNKTISDVFCKAATALCSSLPNYGITSAQPPLSVTGDVDNTFSATVDDMANQEGTASHVMACACASNLPGGGAIANAEVEGVSLESVAKLAQAR